MPAAAQAQSLPLIRDAEIEQLLRDYSAPILRAAGLAQQNIRIVIINERAFNAFVADGRRIFINTGVLSEATTPNEVIGVLAHETGHIAGGHLAKLREQLRSASTQSIIAMVLGIGAMVAASQSGSTNAANVGAAAVTAPQEIIRRSLLAYLRAHEEQADRAGGEVPQRHQPIGQGHARHLQAACRPVAVRGAFRRSIYAVASDAGRARGRAGASSPRRARSGTRKTPPICNCAMT